MISLSSVAAAKVRDFSCFCIRHNWVRLFSRMALNIRKRTCFTCKLYSRGGNNLKVIQWTLHDRQHWENNKKRSGYSSATRQIIIYSRRLYRSYLDTNSMRKRAGGTLEWRATSYFEIIRVRDYHWTQTVTRFYPQPIVDIVGTVFRPCNSLPYHLSVVQSQNITWNTLQLGSKGILWRYHKYCPLVACLRHIKVPIVHCFELNVD